MQSVNISSAKAHLSSLLKKLEEIDKIIDRLHNKNSNINYKRKLQNVQ